MNDDVRAMIDRLDRLDTCAISDALDQLGRGLARTGLAVRRQRDQHRKSAGASGRRTSP